MNSSLLAPTADDDFRPPWWLRNHHVQSILSSTSWRRGRVLARAQPLLAAAREVLLDCGDGVRLQCFVSRPARSGGLPVVLMHGWEGSADSLYILSLAQRFFARGFDVVRLNLRDHGETHQLNRGLFHSCLLPEVIGAVRSLQQHFPHRALQLAGFSLGGNFWLRVAAQARAAKLQIARVVAVSPVLDPVATLRALQKSIPGYEAYFVRKWMRSLVKKQAAWPEHYDFGDFAQRNLTHMTDELVRRYTDFASLEDYLNGYAITGTRLADLEVPSHIITSLDDPIIPPNGLEQLARPPALTLTITRHGGHCGFFEHLSGPTWLERRILGLLGAGTVAEERLASAT
ncbi:MAG: alpha/beta fold hydrolase [Proteobacteria bacterium]|nr:alpha/beta fold hydrolase [Pseudomonadota bacterium]